MKLCIWPEYELRGAAGRRKLTPQEGLMMTAFFSHPKVTQKILVETLWPIAAQMPDGWYNSLAQVMHRLRKNLRPFRLDHFDNRTRRDAASWLVLAA